MISVRNLTYRYPSSDQDALQQVDFDIPAGEIFGFLGPSGAGKSTCQKILYKIIDDYQGEVSVGGISLDQWPTSYFEKIGVGFELPNHYGKLTARENLNLFAGFYPKDKCAGRDALIELVGLTPDVDKPVDTFSKGMKMRLNFVRAIMHDPEIIFFDEPTAGLDPNNAQIIKEHIKELRSKGKTIFITTHDMSTADDLCDRVSFLVAGQIVVTEAPSTLKLRHGQDLVKVELANGKIESFPLLDIGENPLFLNFIRSAPTVRIHTQEATLEKVFIEVTGTALQT